MVQILYTGAVKFNEPQDNPSLSLGGYISSSEVPSGYIGNIFGTISKYTIQQNRPEVRVLGIKNVGGSTLEDVRIYTTSPADKVSSLLVGVADPVVDECGDLYTPHIKSPYAAPYDVSFVDAEGAISALPVGDLAPGDYLLLFLKRVLSEDLQSVPSDEDLLTVFEEGSSESVEDINLTILWD